MEHASLYERLGGAAGIETIVDDIIDRHMKNPVVQKRYLPLKEKPEHFAEVRRHLIDFLAEGSGGLEKYKGMSMPEAHRGMNISVTEYYAVVDDIMGALRANDRDVQTQKDVLFIAFSLQPEICHL